MLCFVTNFVVEIIAFHHCISPKARLAEHFKVFRQTFLKQEFAEFLSHRLFLISWN